MKLLTKTTLSLGAALVCAAQVSAQSTVTVDPSTLTFGYMNWTPAPGDAAGYGGAGGGPWALSDLRASFSGTTLTLQPNINTYNAADHYWVNADGSGANIMDANIYNDVSGVYVNTTLTFNYNVLSSTLAAPYSSVAFIKDFAPDYSSFTEATSALVVGNGHVTFNTSANAGDHIQYGFETFGPDANPSSAAAMESVVIGPSVVPEPATWAWAASGSVLLLSMIRRRNK